MAGSRDHGYAPELDVECPDGEEIALDTSALRGMHPLCAVRLQLLLERHRIEGRKAQIVEPTDTATKELFQAFGIGKPMAGVETPINAGSSPVILPLRQLHQPTEVDQLANALLDPLVEHFDDVAVVRDAVLMAFSELCQNAIEHGASNAGCMVAMSRVASDGIGKVLMAVGDLGVGIPAHVRRSHPELVVDEHAIGQALEAGFSGTDRADRGYGFHWVLEETLVSAATAAEMFIRAGSGCFRREISGGRPRDDGWRSSPTRGTWLAHEWTTIVGGS